MSLPSILLHNDEAHDDGIYEMHPMWGNIDIHPRCAPKPTAFPAVRLGNVGVSINTFELGGDSNRCQELTNEERSENY